MDKLLPFLAGKISSEDLGKHLRELAYKQVEEAKNTVKNLETVISGLRLAKDNLFLRKN